MSVGGRVAYTRDMGYVIEIGTWEEEYPSADFVCVRVEKSPQARSIEPGDTVWCQGRNAYWTPKGRKIQDTDGSWHEVHDVEMPRVGYSYSVKSEGNAGGGA